MKKANSALPETGEKKLSLSLIGLSLVALSLFGWAITKETQLIIECKLKETDLKSASFLSSNI